MPDRHKHQPITFRPPEGDRARLLAYTEQTGQPVRRVLARALTEFLDRVTGVTTERGVTTGRKPAVQQRTEDKANHRCPVKGWCSVCGEMKGAKR